MCNQPNGKQQKQRKNTRTHRPVGTTRNGRMWYCCWILFLIIEYFILKKQFVPPRKRNMAWNMDVGQASIVVRWYNSKESTHTHNSQDSEHVDVKQWNRKHPTHRYVFGLFTLAVQLSYIFHFVNAFIVSLIVLRRRCRSFCFFFSSLLICSEATFSQVLFEMQFCLGILRILCGQRKKETAHTLCHFLLLIAMNGHFENGSTKLSVQVAICSPSWVQAAKANGCKLFISSWMVCWIQSPFIHSYTLMRTQTHTLNLLKNHRLP